MTVSTASGTMLTKTWNYNSDGVAHYGMLSDFLHDVRTYTNDVGKPAGKEIIDSDFLKTADHFFRTWQKAESQAASAQ